MLWLLLFQFSNDKEIGNVANTLMYLRKILLIVAVKISVKLVSIGIISLAYIASGGSLIAQSNEKNCKITGIYMLYVQLHPYFLVYNYRVGDF